MTDTLRVTILGCASSPGVPRIGGGWGACDPDNPKNRRLRCSILVERIKPDGRKTQVLVDTSPDLREQSLRAGFGRIDAVLYTHAHADHLHGIDDLRAFALNMRQRVDIYADQATRERVFQAFEYCFRTPEGSGYPPILTAHDMTANKAFEIDGEGGPIPVLPIPQIHAGMETLAFRFGPLAYSPDVSHLPDASALELKDLKVWIVDAMRYKPHPSHFSVDEALEWVAKLKPERAILTHMHIDLDYETLRSELPHPVEPAFDGMVVELPL